ncbi:hypothetical protein ABZ714_24870 [Streptomyces sp. NPDC006798]|uniref:hypothetical protein n=1 Tax=Streptomyces sp. NPDC006798 TaxID=3155462 RepID=UPI0033CBE165
MNNETQPRNDAADVADGTAIRRRSRRGAWITAALAAIVLIGGTFTYFNTNLLESGRLCYGWVTPDEADRALGGGIGKVTASEGSAGTCTMEKASWLPGEERRISLRADTENKGFPFPSGVWKLSGDMHVLSGGTHGAYDKWGGWAMLPAACQKVTGDDREGPVALTASVLNGSEPGDTDGMGRFLASAARGLTKAADCGAPGYGDTADRTSAPSGKRPADLAKACGIEGFRLDGLRGPRGERVTERIIGEPGQAVYCDLTFEGDETGPFARFAAVGDPPLVATFGDRRFTRARCDGAETVFAHDLRYFDKSELAAMRMPDSARFSKAFGDAARAALRCP